MKGLWNFLLFWVKISNSYNKLKDNPDKQNSAVLGVTSIAMSITGVLTAVGFSYFAYICFTTDGLSAIVAFLLGALSVLIAVACFFQLVVSSIFYAAYQMKLNKRAIGKVALALSLILLVVAIIGIIIIIAVVSK